MEKSKDQSKMSIYKHQQCFLFPIWWFHWDFVERNLLHHSTKGGSVRYAEHGLPVKSIVKALWKTQNELFEWDGNELVLHHNEFLLRNSDVTFMFSSRSSQGRPVKISPCQNFRFHARLPERFSSGNLERENIEFTSNLDMKGSNGNVENQLIEGRKILSWEVPSELPPTKSLRDSVLGMAPSGSDAVHSCRHICMDLKHKQASIGDHTWLLTSWCKGWLSSMGSGGVA